jgi:hypothetical protein
MDKKAKIQAAIDALPNATGGDWWIDDHRGEMHNDPIGSVKLAKQVDGGNLQQRDANRKVISAARDLAEEVVRLRGLVKDAFDEGYSLSDKVDDRESGWKASWLPAEIERGPR